MAASPAALVIVDDLQQLTISATCWSTVDALLRCVLCGGAPFTAADLCHIASTCKHMRDCASASPNFWSHLDISQLPCPTRFFEDGIASRKCFSAVKMLSIQFCGTLTDDHLTSLPPSVRRLSLDACHGVSDAGLKSLAAICGRSLELLSLYWNNRVTDRGLLLLSLRCPCLTSLCLSGCKQVGSAGVLALASRCRRLTSLDLTRLVNVDDTAVAAVVQANPTLCELRLFAVSQCGDQPLLTVAQYCRRMQTLDLTGLSKLTDAALVALGSDCRELHTLLLSWATAITDVGVCAVARGCPLACLSLHGLRHVREAALEALATHCAQTLTAIDVRGCLHLERPTQEELRRLLPRLTTFVLHKG